MILDTEIPTADPGAVIIQYTPLLYRVLKRYQSALEGRPDIDIDDLLQSGRMAIYAAQKQYDPNGDASFMTFIYKRIRWAMYRALGFDPHTGELPEALISLDEPVSQDTDTTRGEFIPDTAPTAEDQIIEDEEHRETAEAVRAAVDRLKNLRQKEAVTRCWLNGQAKPDAAAEMGISIRALQMLDLEARYKLRRDKELQKLDYGSFHVGVSRFNRFDDWP